VVSATNEKSPSKRGHRVKFFGLMSEREKIGATEMCMKRWSEQEGRKLSTNTTSKHRGSDNAGGRSNIHSTGNKMCSNNSWRGMSPEGGRRGWGGRR
jgi:hypothetical protein